MILIFELMIVWQTGLQNRSLTNIFIFSVFYTVLTEWHVEFFLPVIITTLLYFCYLTMVLWNESLSPSLIRKTDLISVASMSKALSPIRLFSLLFNKVVWYCRLYDNALSDMIRLNNVVWFGTVAHARYWINDLCFVWKLTGTYNTINRRDSVW